MNTIQILIGVGISLVFATLMTFGMDVLKAIGKFFSEDLDE